MKNLRLESVGILSMFISKCGQLKFPYLELFETRIVSEDQKYGYLKYQPMIFSQMLYSLCHRVS